MSIEQSDEVELRDLVLQALESNGTLNKFRSQLRASVFLAMENNKSLKSSAAPKDDSILLSILKSTEGLDILGICRDILSTCGLTYSLNVFDSEIKQAIDIQQIPDRIELTKRLHLQQNSENVTSDMPVVADVLVVQKIDALAHQYSVSSDEIVKARKYFQKYNQLGCISFESSVSILNECFPVIDRKVLESYCSDNLHDEQVHFEEFLSLYCYFLSLQSFSASRNEREIVTTSSKTLEDPADGNNNDKEDPLDLFSKSAKTVASRRNQDDDLGPFNLDNKAPSGNVESRKESISFTFDAEDAPDESASFFNEQPPWETEKEYADDFTADEVSVKSQIESDLKVTDVSDGEEDFTVDEASVSDRRSSTEKNPDLQNHPRLANVQFLEDLETTKL